MSSLNWNQYQPLTINISVSYKSMFQFFINALGILLLHV